MRFLLVTALLGILSVVAVAADVTGKWTAEAPGRDGNTVQNTFVFKADGAKLTGTLDNGNGNPVDIAGGKVEGDTISFYVVRSFGGNDIKIAFKGAVSGSEIKFTRSIEGFDGAPPPVEFTAKKAN
jgi:hypothetical protein